MLGNDIVDFSIDEYKYNNQRFTGRILSNLEKEYLDRSENKNAYLWTLWAAKESAYKAYQKSHIKALFSPVKFEVNENQITCTLVGNGELRKNDISFLVDEHPGRRFVTTISTNKVLTTGEYAIIS